MKTELNYFYKDFVECFLHIYYKNAWPFFSAKIWGLLHTTHNFLEYYQESSIPIIRGSEQGGI